MKTDVHNSTLYIILHNIHRLEFILFTIFEELY